MADDGRLAFDIELVASDFEKQAERVKEKLRSIGDSAVQESKRIDNVFADLGTNTDLSTLEKRFNALRTVISENGLAIKQNTELIEELSEKAKDALAKEDYKTFRSLREDITKAQERITDISAETAEYKHILEELETAAGKFKASLPTEPAPLFYASEEDYNHVKKISEEIEELRSKLSETTTDDEFVAINDQIIDLQDELDKCNNKAAEAASALGNNLGNSAAEASTKLYELNDAVKQQEDIYNGLVDELDKVTEKLNEATQAGDTDKVKELQLEYQELSSQVQDASNSLESLKGQQKDASDEWSRMSASINESNGSLVNLLGGQEKYNTIISNLPGPLKGAVNGLSGMVKAAKAFIATPLGAIITVIVGALTAMKTALTGSVDGQKKLAHATGYLQGVLGQLKEVVLKLGQALINMFTNPKEAITNLWQHIKNVLLSGFNVIKEATMEYANIWKSIVTFDWKGVKEHANNFKTIFTDIFEKGKDAVSEYIKKLNEAGKEMGEIAEARKNLEIEESKWQTRKTELEGQESEAMMRMRDTSLSVEEREKALKEYENIINTISGKELSFINQKIALQKREMALTTNNIEKENELRSLETERAQVLANRQRQMTSLQRQRNSLLKAEKAEDSEAIKELRERQQKEIDIMEDGLKKQLAIIDLNYQKELDAIKKREDELKEKNNGTLTAEQQANMDKYRALALQKKEKDDAEARLKWQKSEIETEKETINLRLAEVRKGSEEELRLRLALIEKERQAALIENKLRPEGQRQNESDINTKFDNDVRILLGIDTNAEDNYTQFLTNIRSKTKVELQKLLKESVRQLEILKEIQGEVYIDPREIEELENKIERLKSEIEIVSLEDIKEQVSELGGAFVGLGEEIGGTFGKIMSLLGEAFNTTSTIIENIISVATTSMDAIEETADKAAKGIAAAQSAVAILAIIQAIYTIVVKLRDALDETLNFDGTDSPLMTFLSDFLHYLTDTETMVENLAWSLLGPLGTAIGALTSNNKNSGRQKQKEELKELDRLYESINDGIAEYDRQANETFGQSNAEIRRQQIELKKAQIEIINTKLEAERANSKKKRDEEAINDYERQKERLRQEIEDLGKEALDAIWGENVKSAITSLSDALIDAWSNNTDAAKASQDAIRNMVKKRLREELLDSIQNSEKIAKIREAIENALSDGIVTDKELEELEQLGDNVAKELEDKYGTIFRMLGGSASGRDAQAKGIATASQESIDELNGRMTAVQGHTFNISENSNAIRDILQGNISAINGNIELIRDYTSHLVRMDNDMREIRSSIQLWEQTGIRLQSA